MNIYISTKDGLIHTNDKTYKINAWTEYGLTYNTIPTCYNDTKSEKRLLATTTQSERVLASKKLAAEAGQVTDIASPS